MLKALLIFLGLIAFGRFILPLSPELSGFLYTTVGVMTLIAILGGMLFFIYLAWRRKE